MITDVAQLGKCHVPNRKKCYRHSFWNLRKLGAPPSVRLQGRARRLILI